MLYFHGFSLLWNVSFLLAVSHFIIACSTCIWYFDPDQKIEKTPILKSWFWLIRYHLGTIAFASLILAIVWAFRIVAQYVHVVSFNIRKE